MWKDLIEWANTALGRAIVAPLAVALIAAVAARVSKNARRVIVATFRWIFSIRLTTTSRIDRRVAKLIAERQKHVIDARWVIGLPKDNAKDQFILMNMAAGSVAHAVRVDSDSSGFGFLTGANWKTLDAGQEVRFGGHWDQFMSLAPSFTVTWTDEAGTVRRQFVRLLGT